MGKFPFGKTALAVLTLGTAWFAIAPAQDFPNKKAAEPTSTKNESSLPPAYRTFATRPDLHYAADVRFKLPGGQERVLYVVPQNKGSDLFVKGLFFYTPAMFLAENEKPVEGFPTVVQDAEKQPDGSTLLWFKSILNSDLLSQHARDAVLQQTQARALWTKDGLKEDDIQVRPWPVVHAIIAIVDVRQEDGYIAVTQSEIRGGSTSEFGFRLTGQELDLVQALAKKGRLGFVYSYSFVGKGQDYGEIDLEAVRNLKVSLESKLSSEQLKGNAPIFQAEANEAARYTALMIRRTGRSNNPNVLALVNTPSLMQQLFARTAENDLTLDDLKKGDEVRAQQVAAYLTPQVEQLQQAMRAEQADRKLDERTDFDVVKDGSSVNAGAGISIYGIGLNFGVGTSNEHSKGREVKKRLESVTGSEWQVVKDERKLIPHKIFTYKFIQGSDQILLTDRSATYIAVDKENYYYQDKVVSFALTDKVLETLKPYKGSALAGYDGVPLGGMIPYFGVKPPKGYRWCNGNDPSDYPARDNVFPQADWVPKHLVGTPLPDMRERFVGGGKNESEVGRDYSGRLVVDASNFGIESATETKSAVAMGDVNFLKSFDGRRAYEILREFRIKTAISNQEDYNLQNPFDKKIAKEFIVMLHDYFSSEKVPAFNYVDKYVSKVTGNQTLNLNSRDQFPAHVICRWIIRVD